MNKIKYNSTSKVIPNRIEKETDYKKYKNFSFKTIKQNFTRNHSQDVYAFNNLIDDFLISQKIIVKESTFSHYNNIINTHIRPYFGNMSLNEINLNVINTFINEKLNSGRIDGRGGLSNKSVKDISSIMKLIIRYGISRGVLPFGTADFSVPKERKKDIKTLTIQDMQTLENYVSDLDDSYKLGTYICLYTGLRIGEICALKWDDIDFTNSLLKVNKTILRISNMDNLSSSKTKIIIDTPKTDSSIREIPLPNKLIKHLSTYRNKVNGNNIYVLTGTEKYIEPRNYYKKYKQYLSECNIPYYTFHTLRHTFATRCVEIGFDPKTLSEILGHSDVKITLSRYVHPSMDLKRTCMDKLFEVNI